MNAYALVRIIGNELPPRDTVGNRIRSLKFILEHEPKLENCTKIWVINQIHCPTLKHEILSLLKDHQTVSLDFNVYDFKKAISFDDKVVSAININKARNFGLDTAKGHKFTFIFDGDCFFTENLWNITVDQIERDQLVNDRKYYGVPGIRAVGKIPDDPFKERQYEPSMVFRNDAALRFNENIPFAKNDKLNLMEKLGYTSKNAITTLHGNLCMDIGCLIHISFNEELSETSLSHRMKLREESIGLLVKRLEKQYATKFV